MPEKAEIAVVVPAHNEADYIGDALDALYHQQTNLATNFIVVNNALLGLSKPNKCLFFVKNSETEIDCCFLASSSATVFVIFFL